jgi:antitoxin ParD1/3/4
MNENDTVQNTTLNVSLPEPLNDYVQERVSEGIYSNPSDYVRSLIRDDMRQSARRRLETLLLEGINSGDPKPIDWEAIREEAYRRSGKAAPGI